MVRIHINDQTIETAPGNTVLRVARECGISIPTLCFHPALKPSGSCKLCAVAVESATGRCTIMLACVLKVKEGLRVRTDGDQVKQARTKAFKRLLAMAPLSERLRDLALKEQIDLPRAPDGCIRCRLCIRVCKEVIGKEALRMEKQAGVQRVVPVPDQCIGCGTCANLCPTHAIRVQDENGIRTVRIRETVCGRYPLKRCEGCGKYYATEKQIELMEQRTAPHPQVKTHHNFCATCAKLFSDRLVVMQKQPPRQKSK